MRELAPEHRIIAPDHLSMGYSEQVPMRRYHERVADVADLLCALGVEGPVWLVAQDWGGALAMGFATTFPHRVSGMVLSNTGIAVPSGRRAPRLIKVAASHGLHKLTTQTTSLFVWGTSRLPGRTLTRGQRNALAAPYRSRKRRRGVGEFVADVPFSETHPSYGAIATVADLLPSLTIPVRLVWGARDPVFNDDFAEDLRGRFHNVELHRIADAGHLAVLETSIAPIVESAISTQQLIEQSIEVEATSVSSVEPLWSRISQAHGIGVAHRIGVAISDAAANETVTNDQFDQRVAAFAKGLYDRGVKLGDRVAILIPPGIDLIASVYACWRIGAVTVIADRGLGLKGLRSAVRSAHVNHVLGPRKAQVVAHMLRWAPGASRINVKSLAALPSAIRLNDLQLTPPLPDHPAAVLFTSGATGPAKGVRYSHRQLCAQRDALQGVYNIAPDDRFVAAFAPFALFGPALGITTGLADMDVTSPSTLTASALDAACRRIDATMVFASPAALANVVATATQSLHSLRKVRIIMSAGAPVPVATLEAMSLLCPDAELHTPYGMTEVLPVADVELRERVALGDGRGVCVGRPVDGCEVMVVSSEDAKSLTPFAAGVTGEILVCAPWMSSGYDRLWHTEHVARPVVAHGEILRVWHRTGDVGHIEATGNIWIKGA